MADTARGKRKGGHRRLQDDSHPAMTTKRTVQALPRKAQDASVTAPMDAEPTSLAYLARTPCRA